MKNNKGLFRFYAVFVSFVLVFMLVKWAVPSVAKSPSQAMASDHDADSDTVSVHERGVAGNCQENLADRPAEVCNAVPDTLGLVSLDLSREDAPKHRIFSVSSFEKAFPDVNDTQLPAAIKMGIKSCRNRAQAESMKNQLVYISSCPYYHVDKLDNSIPYLVPAASKLLADIGRVFLDSLRVKHIPLNIIRVSSVLRTQEDVEKLQRKNPNSTTQSCHCYGTTVDIRYNRYLTVDDPDSPSRRQVSNDTLKWVLSEVLNDMRKAGRCYVKHEKKQACFHLTVRR